MEQERFRKLTILHSNDLHGDFISTEQSGVLLGGMCRLSGYIQKVRNEEENVIYCISGDMLQGSIIDTEYRGVSTIEIMNMIGPDVAALGNHETDYGLTHLLFLERCARFPIVNANIFIKNPHTRLFESHAMIMRHGMRIMFIGIITEDVMSHIKSDKLVSTLIDVHDAAQEVGAICDAHRSIDVDLTVLLTHVGFEQDKKLAALLDPEWGVDIIIGGHSHTELVEPEVVNDILIVQAKEGTRQIGRFDLVVDTDLNTVHSYKWQAIPITEEVCPTDNDMACLVRSYKEQVDRKFSQMLCRLQHRLTHPARNQETAIGNLISDAFKESLGVDIMLYGSGSVRTDAMGPLITLGTLMETLPYTDRLYTAKVTGKQLKAMWRHILREAAFTGERTEFFQFSRGLEITWSRSGQEFLQFDFEGEPVEDEQKYSIAYQTFHRNNFLTSFGIPHEDVLKNGREVIIATDEQEVLVGYFSEHESEDEGVDGRLVVLP